MLFVNERKKIGKTAHAFRRAEHEISLRIEGIMKNWNAFFLQLWPQINKDIAASDQIDMRKRRVLAHVLPGKGAHVTNGATDLVATVRCFGEKATETRGARPFATDSG